MSVILNSIKFSSLLKVAAISQESSAGIEETSAATEQTSASMEEVTDTAEHLAQLGKELNDLVPTLNYNQLNNSKREWVDHNRSVF